MGGKHTVIGKKYGIFLVLEELSPLGHYKNFWCQCECGRTLERTRRNMTVEKCGFECGLVKYKTHSGRLFNIYDNMRGRCYRESNNRRENYGNRGIKICDEWKNDFWDFERWAMEHGYNDDLTIDRIDNDGDYTPDNCQWADYKTQANNMSRNVTITIFNESKTISQWADDDRCQCNYKTLHSRIQRGWTLEKALLTPTRPIRIADHV